MIPEGKVQEINEEKPLDCSLDATILGLEDVILEHHLKHTMLAMASDDELGAPSNSSRIHLDVLGHVLHESTRLTRAQILRRHDKFGHFIIHSDDDHLALAKRYLHRVQVGRARVQ